MNKSLNFESISTPFFNKPGILSGMSKILDLGCTFEEREICLDSSKADFLATQSDWNHVGMDLKEAINQWEDSEK